MKHKKHFLNFFISPDLWELDSHLLWRRGLVIVLLLLFNVITTAQETPVSGEFPIGSTFGSGNRTTQALYDSYSEAGMNMIEQYATDSTRSFIEDYNLNALNMDREQDWIYFYSSSFYSKWQAEEEQDTPYVGFKHRDSLGNLIGSPATWHDTLCWSTIGLTSPRDSLLFGPHYHQEKWYRRWLYAGADPIKMNGIYDVRYIPRWRMALDTTNSNIDPNEDVCRLSVWVRHAPEINGVWNGLVYDHLLKESQTLKVSDFSANGQFKEFYFSDNPTERWYRYPVEYQNPGDYYKLRYPDIPDISDTVWVDIYGNNGVEYRVEWLRSDAKCTLYVDYVEVYDVYGWSHYIENPELVTDRIISYADSFEAMQWTNIKRWIGATEPYTIDSYIPIRTVDSLLRENGSPPLMVQVYPYWNVKINEDSQLVRYYKTTKPDPLAIHFFPFNSWNVPSSYGDWNAYRTQLQISHSLTGDKGFWYQAQDFGYELPGGGWLGYRQPDSSEHKAEIMLALAHGIKGLVFAHYDSYTQDGYTLQGLVKNDPQYTKTELWYMARDNIIPRLKGTLGKTLMNLDYTGNYINIAYDEGPPPENTPNYFDYILINCLAPHYFWHSGFFNEKNHLDNKYFLLANLKVNNYVEARLRVTNNTGYKNVSFKDIEYGVDTTIAYNTYINYNETLPAGEGRLYRVAPVIKYGGKLIYNETISNETTLLNEMTIEDDAVLTINSTYNVDRTITIKDNGSIVTTSGGTMKFYNNLSLVVEGSVTISGTPQHKLILDFISPADSNGIVIKPGGSLTISYCEIKNAGTGIFSELNADSLIVEYVDFIDCEDYSISVTGSSDEENAPIIIDNCTIENSEYGISVNNTSSILIRWNEITDTDCGIRLSTVSDALIVCNNIGSGKEELQGILSLSSGGIFYGNMISGHTSAIQLGNSSPKIGVNTITDNKYHGIYVGANSNPYMKGEYIGNPALPYGLSGYNTIYENGGYQETGGPPDNDGSEIYFYNSKAVLINGCNSIVDDRPASPPLINTLLLMNGYTTGLAISLKSQHNFWGDTVYAARFGNLNVQYIPYEVQPCPIPIGGGSDGELVMMNQFGQVIDTIYKTGVEVPELSVTELDYAEAEEYYLTGDLTSALQIYEDIITSSATEEEKYYAYERKYSIGKSTGQSTEFFNELSNTFLTLASNTQDTLDAKILNQLSTLSKVGKQEYETAISEFDNIVQQNPNTEEAVYAEIDALTTALLLEEADTTLQKGRLGKYLITSTSDYNQKIDEILRKNFGGSSKENAKEILPTEYTLYQNYPNPFNPSTTIKYDLPASSDVSLIIYDILGRKVKELVNTKQQAGRYEVQFNASNLASGVYIYQLIADKFISSRKMILLK